MAAMAAIATQTDSQMVSAQVAAVAKVDSVEFSLVEVTSLTVSPAVSAAKAATLVRLAQTPVALDQVAQDFQ